MHAVNGGKIGGTLASTSEHQQLLLEKKIFSQEGFGAAESEEFGETSQ